MLVPLEYSMTLWWIATPQWGTEPDSDFVASAIEAIDTLDPVAQDAVVPARLPVPMRSFVTGYIWTAEPHWAECMARCAKPSRQHVMTRHAVATSERGISSSRRFHWPTALA